MKIFYWKYKDFCRIADGSDNRLLNRGNDRGNVSWSGRILENEQDDIAIKYAEFIIRNDNIFSLIGLQYAGWQINDALYKALNGVWLPLQTTFSTHDIRKSSKKATKYKYNTTWKYKKEQII